MKYFYYNIVSSNHRNMYGGYNVKANVYQCKRNQMILLGQIEWCTSGFKGEVSCVYEFLFNKGLVNKKQYNLSNGYYYKSLDKKKIIIEPI